MYLAGVSNEYPAGAAGLESGDKLVSVNGTIFTDSSQFAPFTKENRGKEVSVTVDRGGERVTETFQLKADDPNDIYFGASAVDREETRSTWSAPIVGGVLVGQFSVETVKLIGSSIAALFAGDTTTASDNVAGPVGIFGAIGNLENFTQLLFVMGIISISLAVANALPIPALDGGRFFLTTLYEKLLRKPLKPSVENAVHGTGFALLLGLIILITISDISKF